jgi:hypothetical protein
MAKQLLPDPITHVDLKEYLLSNDDFAFEREIYHLATTLKLDKVEHAALYEDPLQRKQRQFDIRAAHTQEHNTIQLSIECKRLNASFPLLISCVPRSEGEALHQNLSTFQRVGGGTTYVRANSVRPSGPQALYPPGLLVGKSMTQVGRERDSKALTGGDAEVFDKWAQSLASMAEMIESAVRYLCVRRTFVPRVAFLPVLVVPDGTLWGAKYSSRGELMEDPTNESEITFYVGRKYDLPEKYRLPEDGPHLEITHLHVCTSTAVSDMLYRIVNGGGIWQQLFPA